MQTRIEQRYLDDPSTARADDILRKCVHCGFCLATCPTYNLLGDELDSPRGRIYLIKQVLEGQSPTVSTQQHLDRCLTCRNCETTCPSGVEYSQLVDIGRHVVNQAVPRPAGQKLLRRALIEVLPYRSRVTPLVRLGQMFRPLLPKRLKNKLPARQSIPALPVNSRTHRRMLLLQGCVQPSMTPATNACAKRIFQRLGIDLIELPSAGCCGAIAHHLDYEEQALDQMRRNVDVWSAELDAGAEWLVITASGCGAEIKEYGRLLADDPVYAERAAKVASRCRDIAEVLHGEALPDYRMVSARLGKTAYHPPCTLQHAQKLPGIVEAVLQKFGVELVPVKDSHTCCGSAGTYSVLQPELATRLRDQKLGNLVVEKPKRIVTSNIGCQLHLQTGSEIPVSHWIELVDEIMSESQTTISD